jgi:hypothetical protein
LASLCAAIGGASVATAHHGHLNRLKADARTFSNVVAIQPQDMQGVGPGQQGRGDVFCGPFGEAGRGAFDKDVSCDDSVMPDNETAIAVHPTNPNLVLMGSNDYQLYFQGAALIVQVPAGWFFSSDGGGTWTDGEFPLKGSLGGGDPVPEFDVKHNQMVFSSLSFVCGQFAPVCSRGNILFGSAKLGPNATAPQKIEWSEQTVANGSGADGSAQQIFLDKEWMAVDNNPSSPHFGNIYITFSAFRLEHGGYDESPIWFVKSEDGGKSWTLPVEISGRHPAYCTYQDDPDDTANRTGPNSNQANAEGPDDPFACDQDQFSIPVVAPNGDLYVHFHNEQNLQAYELPQRYDSQIMIVKSTDGGDTFFGETPSAENQEDNPTTATNEACVRQEEAAAGDRRGSTYQNPCIVPLHVVNLEDSYDTHNAPDGTQEGFPDYPLNLSGRTTLTGHQFRVNSAGNIAVGPNATPSAGELPYRLWVVFADNIDGVRPGTAATPAVSNTNVFYAYSDDGGVTWVGGDPGNNSDPATRLAVHPRDVGPVGADQWFPWADTDSAGNLHVGYMDAQLFDGPVRELYGFSHAMVGANGVPSLTTLAVSSAPSDPNRSIFFRARVGGCFDCATFIGDYNGLVVDSQDRIHSTWTDMRRTVATVPRPVGCGTGTNPPCTNVNLKIEDAFYARVPPPTP